MSQPSQKRVSVSPASVNHSKRRAVSREEIDLQCLICQDFAVDATQTMCCGALHCRSCVSQCKACPNCRKPLTSDSIIPDVRCERLSAARHRSCPYAENGCVFGGNRSAVAAHEQQCDFVPRSVLRQKIEEMAATIAAKDAEILKKKKDVARAADLVVARELIPVLEGQKALMKSALGADPARSALRTLYGLPPSHNIIKVKRDSGRDARVPSPDLFTWESKAVVFRVEEKNHNVAVFFARDSTVAFDSNFEQGERLQVTLLHPYDVKRAFKISLDLTKLNRVGKCLIPNFMTSRQLSKYCVGGFYYFESDGAIPEDAAQKTCHCIRHFFKQSLE